MILTLETEGIIVIIMKGTKVQTLGAREVAGALCMAGCLGHNYYAWPWVQLLIRIIDGLGLATQTTHTETHRTTTVTPAVHARRGLIICTRTPKANKEVKEHCIMQQFTCVVKGTLYNSLHVL